MAQPIVVRCPKCSQKYRLPSDKLGMKARCRCGQRFTVAGEKPVDDDTIFGWVVEGADPSSQSVLGGTGIVKSPAKPPARVREEHVVARPLPSGLRLERIDELGAHFEFPSDSLAKRSLRGSFPKQCVGCSVRRGLHVHRIVWSKKLPRDDPLRIRDVSHQPIGKLEELQVFDREDWLSALPELKQAPRPFNYAFPFYVCGHCTLENEVIAAILSAQDVEYCQLCIANLEVAAKFFRNNGGRNTQQYARLVQEGQRQQSDRWRRLPTAVRRQISHWHKLESDEKFLGYFPDADFGRAEAGKAGVVLTSKRLAYHKYTSSRQFSIEDGGRIYVHPEEDRITVRFVQKGRKDATVHLESTCAEELLGELQQTGQQWKISGRLRA